MKNISKYEAINFLNNRDAIFLDVRSYSEFEYGHIPNAISIPIDELNEKIDLLEPYKNENIVIYCSSGSRSFTASSFLSRNGFRYIYNLTGGISPLQNYLVR
ncbi:MULTISPECIES: rhodanese-like domain-containing protein [Clostridium]|uniref:Rhodanese-like domain-containing protein n=1 Tax=Clostridium senegalense TaxID=1465809 RepID=A0A6M0H3G4_9CLOT|nr:MULTISPECIES: rhodanese-like domain-containing protein [Clostridium]MBU5228176.1 rhodanese-like domain-containing protein [Clostridium senegalense]NEU04613.1 rhodanese-like domain-containing protein [Clostridium senegalense]